MWRALVERWQSFSNEQKISVLLLGVCGGFALGLSLYRVKAGVTRPFLVNENEILSAKQLIGESPMEEEARLKRTDTDGDGISDWDESNITKTNPNLRDSCGDGVPDNVRVATGKTGECGTVVIGGVTSEGASGRAEGQPSSASFFSSFGVAAALGGATSTVNEAQVSELQKILPRDAKAIREALKGQVDQSKLDALSDAELLELYDQAIQVQASQPAALPTLAP